VLGDFAENPPFTVRVDRLVVVPIPTLPPSGFRERGYVPDPPDCTYEEKGLSVKVPKIRALVADPRNLTIPTVLEGAAVEVPKTFRGAVGLEVPIPTLPLPLATRIVAPR
jgi:hypothetical protein